jgi:hypothetical protein
MALPDSYILKPSSIPAYFDSILDAQAPERFSYKFLENLGFTSTNDRLLIGLLKELGFLNSDGAPQARYYEFLDRSRSKLVLAEAIREAYSDLFAVNKKANDLNKDDVKNKLRTLCMRARNPMNSSTALRGHLRRWSNTPTSPPRLPSPNQLLRPSRWWSRSRHPFRRIIDCRGTNPFNSRLSVSDRCNTTSTLCFPKAETRRSTTRSLRASESTSREYGSFVFLRVSWPSYGSKLGQGRSAKAPAFWTGRRGENPSIAVFRSTGPGLACRRAENVDRLCRHPRIRKQRPQARRPRDGRRAWRGLVGKSSRPNPKNCEEPNGGRRPLSVARRPWRFGNQLLRFRGLIFNYRYELVRVRTRGSKHGMGKGCSRCP